MRSLSFGWLLVFALGMCFGQTPKAAVAVTITVSDVAGANIPGAWVVVKSADSVLAGRATTGGNGQIRLPLIPGTYHFSVSEVSGFADLQGSFQVRDLPEQPVNIAIHLHPNGLDSGPCCFHRPDLPLIQSRPLAKKLHETPLNGLVYGKITDSTGTFIPAAQVVAKSQSGERTYSIADSRGEYRFIIAPGTYTVLARFQGFRTGSTKVHLVSDRPASGNIELEIGGCTECVEVQGLLDFMPCITDQSNTPLPTAVVVLSPAPFSIPPDDRTINLDDWGCGWAQVPTGEYQFTVSASGFRSVQQNLAINRGQTTVTLALRKAHKPRDLER